MSSKANPYFLDLQGESLYSPFREKQVLITNDGALPAGRSAGGVLWSLRDDRSRRNRVGELLIRHRFNLKRRNTNGRKNLKRSY